MLDRNKEATWYKELSRLVEVLAGRAVNGEQSILQNPQPLSEDLLNLICAGYLEDLDAVKEGSILNLSASDLPDQVFMRSAIIDENSAFNSVTEFADVLAEQSLLQLDRKYGKNLSTKAKLDALPPIYSAILEDFFRYYLSSLTAQFANIAALYPRQRKRYAALQPATIEVELESWFALYILLGGQTDAAVLYEFFANHRSACLQAYQVKRLIQGAEIPITFLPLEQENQMFMMRCLCRLFHDESQEEALREEAGKSLSIALCNGLGLPPDFFEFRYYLSVHEALLKLPRPAAQEKARLANCVGIIVGATLQEVATIDWLTDRQTPARLLELSDGYRRLSDLRPTQTTLSVFDAGDWLMDFSDQDKSIPEVKSSADLLASAGRRYEQLLQLIHGSAVVAADFFAEGAISKITGYSNFAPLSMAHESEKVSMKLTQEGEIKIQVDIPDEYLQPGWMQSIIDLGKGSGRKSEASTKLPAELMAALSAHGSESKQTPESAEQEKPVSGFSQQRDKMRRLKLKNDDLRERVKELETSLAQLQRENQKLSKQVAEYRESEFEPVGTSDEILPGRPELPPIIDYSGVLVGGYGRWQNKLEKRLPNFMFYNDTQRGRDLSHIANFPRVYFYTAHLSHTLFEKAKENMGADQEIIYLPRSLNGSLYHIFQTEQEAEKKREKEG